MQKGVAGETSDEQMDSGEERVDKPVDNVMALTVTLVTAYVANHTVPAGQLGLLLEQTHRTVLGLSTFRAEPVEAVAIASSVRDDCIMCLEDGKLFRSLKRHLAAHHGMTPAEYRTRWNLPPDYPMVAPNYAASRSQLAISMGLGGKGGRKGRPPNRRKSAE